MPTFKNRSNQKELLDGDGIPFDAIRRNMVELNTINHLLGGHRITRKGVQALTNKRKSNRWHITEVGCGGGDNLRVIERWAARKGIDVALTGIDINQECITYAQSLPSSTSITYIVADYKDVQFEQAPDIIFSSLFTHHFTNSQLVEQLNWLYTQSRIGFFINDLHRHPLAYYSIKTLTRLFSSSYLVKNDAPLSVLRGFRKKEWQQLGQQAGIPIMSCQWQWAFRYLIICKK